MEELDHGALLTSLRAISSGDRDLDSPPHGQTLTTDQAQVVPGSTSTRRSRPLQAIEQQLGNDGHAV
jgi:hypothetical protein